MRERACRGNKEVWNCKTSGQTQIITPDVLNELVQWVYNQPM